MIFNKLSPFSSLSTARETKYDLDFDQSKELHSFQNIKKQNNKKQKYNIIIINNNNSIKKTNQTTNQTNNKNKQQDSFSKADKLFLGSCIEKLDENFSPVLWIVMVLSLLYKHSSSHVRSLGK